MKIKADTIARTICLALALFNQILATAGKGQLAFTEDTVYQTVSLCATIITTIAAWWKNNSFTPAAIRADEVLRQLKGVNNDDGSR